ncbi:MAG: hypothetical protein D6808_02205 [Candidatus Dadabacteria bacterium]|nr:MAG: hypothetical protein D6808_02205 [Candidatus Dadabacteria bacterium]
MFPGLESFDRSDLNLDRGFSMQLGNEAGREYVARLEEAADFLTQRISRFPNILIILGSGLGGLADDVERADTIPYDSIPHMPRSTTEGHAGELIVGSIGERDVALFNGRVHCHDGLHPRDVAFGVRLMALMGVTDVIVTNAAGSLNPDMNVGDHVVLTNHISLFFF